MVTGCGCGSPAPPLSLWTPDAINTDDWIDYGIKMGCKRFIYVAKHGCGFVTWNSRYCTMKEKEKIQTI
jgi:alpha-L-fucosidase